MQSKDIQMGVEYVLSSRKWTREYDKFHSYDLARGTVLAVGIDERKVFGYRRFYRDRSVTNGIPFIPSFLARKASSPMRSNASASPSKRALEAMRP